jgi:ferredoxin
MTIYQDIAKALALQGFLARGGFHPTAPDDAPDDAPGQTILIVGNAGPAMWRAFSKAREEGGPTTLDVWTQRILGPVAATFGARAIYPFDGPPYAPFMRWAMKAEPVHPSPINMTIHPEYGLWHAYRGAFVINERLALPALQTNRSPCLDCADRPCLSACPVDAFSTATYEVDACAVHVRDPAGADCQSQGCRARRACPIGQDFLYAPDQAAFHMAAFLKNN